MQTRQNDDPAEAWVANILDKHDFDIEAGRLKELMKTCADAQAQLSELRQTAYEPPCVVKLDGLIIGYRHASECMKILGIMISGNGRSYHDVQHRVSKASGAFWSLKHIFLNHFVDPVVRLKALEVFVKPVLLHGAGCWTPTKADLEECYRLHNEVGQENSCCPTWLR